MPLPKCRATSGPTPRCVLRKRVNDSKAKKSSQRGQAGTGTRAHTTPVREAPNAQRDAVANREAMSPTQVRPGDSTRWAHNYGSATRSRRPHATSCSETRSQSAEPAAVAAPKRTLTTIGHRHHHALCTQGKTEAGCTFHVFGPAVSCTIAWGHSSVDRSPQKPFWGIAVLESISRVTGFAGWGLPLVPATLNACTLYERSA